MAAIPKSKMTLEEYFELDKNAEGCMKGIISILILCFILFNQTTAQTSKIKLTKSEQLIILDSITKEFQNDLKKEEKIYLKIVETPKEFTELFLSKFGRNKVQIIYDEQGIQLIKSKSIYYEIGPIETYRKSLFASIIVHNNCSFGQYLFQFYRKKHKLIKKDLGFIVGHCAPQRKQKEIKDDSQSKIKIIKPNE